MQSTFFGEVCGKASCGCSRSRLFNVCSPATTRGAWGRTSAKQLRAAAAFGGVSGHPMKISVFFR